MKRLVWLAVFALVVAAIPVGASTFVALSRGELVAQSDAIVEGEVLKVNSFWSRSGRMIVTEALVRVTDKIAGNAPTVVAVRTFGGEVGGFLVEAHGFPKFQVGERVVLFLQDQPNGTAEVTGYRQGQFQIVRDKAGVQIAVPTLEEGVNLLRADGAPVARPKAVRLDELKNAIRADVERVGTARMAN
ncbi:MAG TPA: hypothetical protein VE685_24750 [Thermoanaerobaculia bacterium]|nr:hypothetical protein [Thermoanaerobaculia bacterium]